MSLAAFALACYATLGAENALPDELAKLRDLVNNETALVDTMRAFDKEQTALAEAEEKKAEEDAKAGKKDEAKSKADAARRRYELLRKGYEFVLQNYRNNARAQTYYGEILYDRYGQVAGALAAWHLASALDPKLSAPLNDLGIHYCHVGELQQGLDFFDKAIKLEPDNPDYLFNLAQVYLTYYVDIAKFKKWKKPAIYNKAMKMSKKAAELRPGDYSLAQDYAMNFYAAENLDAKADWKQAAVAWQKARALARTDDVKFYTWLNEGRVRSREGNKKEAAICFNEALRIRPGNEVAQRLLLDLDQEQPQKPNPKKPSPRR